MWEVHHEYSSFREYQRPVLAVVLQPVLGFLRPLGQVVQVARVVAMNEVDWQTQANDRM
jgi:hypothetical protein